MTDTSSEQAVHIRKGSLGDLDWPTTLARLDKVLRIRTTPIGMKMFETSAEMEAVPKIRRPKDIHTADQIVSMASRLNWTVGITGADLVGAQCQAVLGLGAQDDEWYSGKHMAGVWFETIEDSAAHQAAMHVVPIGQFEAMAVSPLSTGRLDPPDICMICADSWGRALSTGEPSLSIPCYAERRYGGVQDDEMLMALQPHQLVQAIDGMEALSRNGLRYPIPPYGIQTDARAGLGASY
jgi:uncharacterized protein (DUF169 family)